MCGPNPSVFDRVAPRSALSVLGAIRQTKCLKITPMPKALQRGAWKGAPQPCLLRAAGGRESCLRHSLTTVSLQESKAGTK